MNFLNVGPWELTVILIIAILMIGPKRMVEITRAIGRITAQMRKLSGEFMSTIQTELQAVERDARQVVGGVGDDGLMSSVASLPSELETLGRETRKAIEGIVVDAESVVKEESEPAEGKQDG